MGAPTKDSRLEMRIDADTKTLAERAAAALGCKTSEYIARLIREHAPETLEAQTTIQATNAQFDTFLAACKAPPAPSARIRAAASRLDKEGL